MDPPLASTDFLTEDHEAKRMAVVWSPLPLRHPLARGEACLPLQGCRHLVRVRLSGNSERGHEVQCVNA